MNSTDEHTNREEDKPTAGGYRGLLVVVLVVVLSLAASASILITMPEALDNVTQPRSGWLGAGPLLAQAPRLAP